MEEKLNLWSLKFGSSSNDTNNLMTEYHEFIKSLWRKQSSNTPSYWSRFLTYRGFDQSMFCVLSDSVMWICSFLINRQIFVFFSASIRKSLLPVKVCRSALQLHMRGKPKNVTVETKPGQNVADFKKSKDGFILLVPEKWDLRSKLGLFKTRFVSGWKPTKDLSLPQNWDFSAFL